MAEVKALKEGYRKFYRKYFTSGDTLYKELAAAGQSPKTLIIACSDSRVDPSIITDARPGDIFVIRNVANLVPPYETDDNSLHGVSAAVEFAVRILEVESIIVLGHSNCAGIQTLIHPEKVQHTDFIGKWMNVAAPVREKTVKTCKDEINLQHKCEQEGIMLSLNNLLTFPWIKSKVKESRLKLYGWYFTLENGLLEEYSPDKEGFEKIGV